MAISTQTKGSAVEQLVYLTARLEHIEETAEKLAEALAFLDMCRATPAASETGALRDAREWVETNAKELISAVHHLPSSKWARA